jgi:hypothetical protein
MKGHGQKFSRLKEKAISNLLTFATVEEAAEKTGIVQSSLRRWMKEPQFCAEYETAKEQVLGTAKERLRSGTLAAVEVLLEVATDKESPASARVQAARSVLESTDLLGSGTSVTVNNQAIPTTVEGIDQAIENVLRKDHHFRSYIAKMIAGIDSEKEGSEGGKTNLLN